MSKTEELKKEAEEYAEQCYGWCNNDQVTDVAIATYITSAEPREKRIADLEEENNKLLDVINNQDVKIAELEQQIEKLKADINEAIEDANRWEETETFSVLNRIYNDNFEVITSVSN